MLGRIVQKSLRLSGGEGLSFFAFPGVSSPHLFKQLYRGRMNSVELAEEQRDRVLQEALGAFQFNIQVGRLGSHPAGGGGGGKGWISRGLSPSSRSLRICRRC